MKLNKNQNQKIEKEQLEERGFEKSEYLCDCENEILKKEYCSLAIYFCIACQKYDIVFEVKTNNEKKKRENDLLLGLVKNIVQME